MSRIEDIGAFNAVREAGLAKILPDVPRITVGMGTCGRCNGAEGVLQSFAELADASGSGASVVPVGCFGACFQEPLVGVRLPGQPMLLLHRVKAGDCEQIMHDIAIGHLSLFHPRRWECDRLTCAFGRGRAR